MTKYLMFLGLIVLSGCTIIQQKPDVAPKACTNYDPGNSDWTICDVRTQDKEVVWEGARATFTGNGVVIPRALAGAPVPHPSDAPTVKGKKK